MYLILLKATATLLFVIRKPCQIESQFGVMF